MADEVSELIPDQVRAACARVAARARSVRIEAAAIEDYARGLPPAAEPPPDPATDFLEGDREGRTAFVICLDAINFGSGWWPTIRKRPGHSGYFTIAAGLTERFRAAGPWSAGELAQLGPADLAAVTGQDPALPLMVQYAASLRDVGERVLGDHGGRFGAVVEAARGRCALEPRSRAALQVGPPPALPQHRLLDLAVTPFPSTTWKKRYAPWEFAALSWRLRRSGGRGGPRRRRGRGG